MPRTARVDPGVLTALAPLRVATTAALLAAGVSSATIARRCRSGRWRPLFLGVVLLHSGEPTREQYLEAARLYAGPGSVLTGVEAARRHGLRRLPDTDEIDMLVPPERQRTSSGLVVVHRTMRLPDPVLRAGVPVVPLDRAVSDAARRTAGLDAVRALIAEAVQRRRTTVARLSAELGAGCQRGSAVPRQVLDEVDDGIRSASEGWARDLHRHSSLPPVMWNPRLILPRGRFLARPDGWFDDVALAWEMDSVEFHPDGDDDTARRRADMVAAGVVVVHHRPRRLLTEPARVKDELWHYYHLAASRPRPDIRALHV